MSSSNKSKIENLEVHRAEKNVKKNAKEFGMALHHLEEKIEDVMKKVDHLKEVIARPKHMAEDFIDDAKLTTWEAVNEVKGHPVAYALIGLSGVGTFFLLREGLTKRRKMTPGANKRRVS